MTVKSRAVLKRQLDDARERNEARWSALTPGTVDLESRTVKLPEDWDAHVEVNLILDLCVSLELALDGDASWLAIRIASHVPEALRELMHDFVLAAPWRDPAKGGGPRRRLTSVQKNEIFATYISEIKHKGRSRDAVLDEIAYRYASPSGEPLSRSTIERALGELVLSRKRKKGLPEITDTDVTD